MKGLIIAEKSALAKNIAAAIKLSGEEVKTIKNQNGVIFESDSYIVVAAKGHLYRLYDVDEYTGISDWALVPLPYFPPAFKFKPIDDSIDYIKNIKSQLERTDVEYVVNAGDAGREGEFLIRLILINLNNTKPVKRLWMPSQVPEEILNSLNSMKDDRMFDGLYNEGLARCIADWCDGINYTRYVTLKTGGKMLRVGRVVSTIVNIIKKRDEEIDSFVSEKYYTVESDTVAFGTNLHLVYDADFEAYEKEYAKALARYLNSKSCKVNDIKQLDSIVGPPKLFSLSKLQNHMSNVYSWSSAKTLDVLEELYLNKYVTYPRTNTEYLPSGEKEKVERIIGRFKQNGYDVIAKPNDKIFDDTKIEDHGAIIPELNFPKDDELNEDSKHLYDAIKNRFLAYFCAEKRIVAKTEVTLGFNDEELDDIKLKGRTTKQVGWCKYDSSKENKDIMLPNFEKGDIIKTNFKEVENKTTPKNHYTVESLNNFLENPLKTIKGNSEEAVNEQYKNLLEGCNIGTPASLSGIIKKAISDEFIELRGKSYYILPRGIYLCDTLNKLDIKMDINKTIHLNKNLKLVSEGNCSILDYIQSVKNDLINSLAASKNIVLDTFDDRVVVGKCPRCGDDVVAKPKSYSCQNTNCKFVLFKEDLFWTEKNKTLTTNLVTKLLDKGEVKVKKLYSKKTQKEYDATVKLVDDGIKTSYKLVFEDKKALKKDNSNLENSNILLYKKRRK